MNMGDLFEAVEALELEVLKSGMEEGKIKGQTKEFEEGFVFGWKQACHIQSEIGMIEGFLHSILLNKTDLDSRTSCSITKLLANIRTYQNWNCTDELELEQKLASIHAKTKLILKKLKISSRILDRQIENEF